MYRGLTFNFPGDVVSDEADWTSPGRLLESSGPAVENEHSPTATSCEWQTLTSLEVDDRSRPLFGRCIMIIISNNIHDNVYGAVIMTKVIARVLPVHLMNVD